MKGQLSQEAIVDVAAEEFWNLCRGVEWLRILHQLIGDFVGKPQVIQGDGGVGTIVNVSTTPVAPWSASYTKELYTKIDDEKRIKEIEVIEGGCKELGFDLYRTRMEIIEKDVKTSVVRSTVEFEIDDKLANFGLSSLKLEGFGLVAETLAKYLNENKASASKVVLKQ